jgi:hypothetical protein
MIRTFLMGCVVLGAAAAATDAAVVAYATNNDVYIEWSNTDGGYSNRNSKGLLKSQWSGGASPTSIVKSYAKFEIPTGVATLNSVTLRLTSRDVGESDNAGDTVEIWALPDGLDGWSETVLTWDQATSTYGNDPSGWYFTAGQQVGSGTCNAGKPVATDFSLDPAKLLPAVQADTDGLITLCLAAHPSTTYWCDRENSNALRRPILTWDYEVPEPATLSLLVLGALVCLRPRR